MTLENYIKDNIDPEFAGNFPFHVNEKKISKDSIITGYGQLEQKVYFLKDGIVSVSLMEREEEKILDFFFKYSFFASYSSLLSGSPSDVSIVAFTDCIMDVIDYSELKKAYEYSLMANKLGRIETEKLYVRKVRREKELLTKTAEQRYLSLISTNSEIIEKIPIKDISKYLGIKPESLSRIRKQIIS